jgi:plasmid stability protein
MSTTPYLDDFGVDPETRRILDAALSGAELRIPDTAAAMLARALVIELYIR